MSGDGDSKAFEVERRVRGHVPVPSGFELTKIVNPIIDRYFSIDPDCRLRYSEVVSERVDGVLKTYAEPKVVRKLTGKMLRKEVMELDTGIGDTELVTEIFSQLGIPEILVVSGHRKAYANGSGMVMTHDVVDRLGDFTEFEVMAGEDEDTDVTIKGIDDFVSTLGIEKDYRMSYPHQLLQLEMLREIYYTPISKKELTAQKLASQYRASVRIVGNLCKELQVLGWVNVDKDKTITPAYTMEALLDERIGLDAAEPIAGPVPEGLMIAGMRELLDPEINNYVAAMVAGKKALCAAPQPRKVAPKVQPISPMLAESLPGAVMKQSQQPPKP